MAEVLLATGYYIYADFITDPKSNEYGTPANYKLIACTTSNGFTASREEIDVSNKCSEGWSDSLSGRGSFGFSLDGQLVSLADDAEAALKVTNQELLQAMLDEKSFFMKLTNLEEDVYREGKVRLTSYDETAGNQEAYTFTASASGIGKPRIVAPVGA